MTQGFHADWQLNGAWEHYWALEFRHTYPATCFWIASDNSDLCQAAVSQKIH